MSRSLRNPARATACLGLLLAATASSLAGCEEDSKTTPERCGDPGLPIFDIQAAGAPADDNAHLNSDPTKPCVTTVGHAISSNGSSAGTTNGGSAGATSGGKGGIGGSASADGGIGGSASADAGAGGAP